MWVLRGTGACAQERRERRQGGGHEPRSSCSGRRRWHFAVAAELTKPLLRASQPLPNGALVAPQLRHKRESSPGPPFSPPVSPQTYRLSALQAVRGQGAESSPG